MSRTASAYCLCLATAFLALPAGFLASTPSKEAREAVVLSVEPAGAASKAGLVPGDVLFSWETPPQPGGEPVRGDFSSPWQAQDLEAESLLRGGSVTLRVQGKKGSKAVSLSGPAWGLNTRPQLAPPQLKAFERGLLPANAADAEGAVGVWEAAARQAESEGRFREAAWLGYQVASVWHRAEEPEKEIAALERSEALALRAGDSLGLAIMMQERAAALVETGLLPEARAALGSALEARRKSGPDGLASAEILKDLGLLAFKEKDSGEALDRLGEAVALARKFASGRDMERECLMTMGRISSNRGDLAGAEGYFGTLLALEEAAGPTGKGVAQASNNLGLTCLYRGDLDGARHHLGKALELKRKLAPGSMTLANTLDNLAIAAGRRGDIESAAVLTREALGIYEIKSPGGLDHATCLGNMARIAAARGDDAGARRYWEAALALTEKGAPDSLGLAKLLNNYAGFLSDSGDTPGAEAAFRRALAIKETLVPWSLDLASSQGNLANMLLNRGLLSEARALMEKCLEIRRALAPGSLEEANGLCLLAAVQASEGNDREAEVTLRGAIAIISKLAPHSVDEARSLRDLGRMLTQGGRVPEALVAYRAAVESLDLQKARLGGGRQAEEAFSRSHAPIYRDLIALEVSAGKGKEAFRTLENFRAASLRSLLSQRDIDLSAEVPEGLLKERARATYDLEKARGALAETNPGRDAARSEALLRESRQAEDRLSDVLRQIREVSPRAAALETPPALDFDAVRTKLPKGALLLSYCTLPDSLLVFAVLGDRLEVAEVPTGIESLGVQVRRFLSLLRDPGSDPAEIREVCKRLYDQTVAPHGKLLRRADRVVICPDGPIHYLPFGALVTSRGRYLIEEKPLTISVSATTYLQIQGRPAPQTGLALVALGDPVPGATGAEGSKLWEPLPFARAEVMGLGALFPGKSRVLVGAEATKSAALGIEKGTKYLHFACHGFAEDRFPLNSALVLSGAPPGSGDGTLKAWEVLESMRVDADLVALSACETGLGRDMGGEGIVGLTRAFQCAGARAVLASLWQIPDEGTGVLMRRFYEGLVRGLSKEQALRSAQVACLKEPRRSHPVHWAAFQIHGD